MIWGFIGVLLAAPLTAIIRISFERFETTKQIARLLEGKIHIKENKAKKSQIPKCKNLNKTHQNECYGANFLNKTT